MVLAKMLYQRGAASPVVLAIPNGGLAVAAPVAQALKAELGVCLVRKVQFPDDTEAGFGALTADGILKLNEPLVKTFRLTRKVIDRQVALTHDVLLRRAALFGTATAVPLEKRDTVLVDDGLASGYTMLAAIESARRRGARSVTVAAPTASTTAAALVEEAGAALICPDVSSRRPFAVADAYEGWYDVSDEEAVTIVARVGNSVGR